MISDKFRKFLNSTSESRMSLREAKRICENAGYKVTEDSKIRSRNFLSESKSDKDIIRDILKDRHYSWLHDSIERLCNKIDPKAPDFDSLEDKDCTKVKKEIEERITDDLKMSIYNWIEGGEIPNTLDISLTKKEFQNSLKAMSGKKIPVERNGFPEKDYDDGYITYDDIMYFYKNYVK